MNPSPYGLIEIRVRRLPARAFLAGWKLADCPCGTAHRITKHSQSIAHPDMEGFKIFPEIQRKSSASAPGFHAGGGGCLALAKGLFIRFVRTSALLFRSAFGRLHLHEGSVHSAALSFPLLAINNTARKRWRIQDGKSCHTVIARFRPCFLAMYMASSARLIS